MAPEADRPEPDEGAEIREPDNSTVDDWFGQNVARDQDVADQAVADADGDVGAAEEQFAEQAEGEETYRAGHPRPDHPREGEVDA